MAKNIFYRLALMLAALMFSPTGAFAASIDEKIDKYFAPFSDVFSSIVFYPANIAGVKIPVVILFLLISSIVATFYFRWIGIWGFKHSLKQIFGKKKTEFNESHNSRRFQERSVLVILQVLQSQYLLVVQGQCSGCVSGLYSAWR